uniref:Ketoacyl_synth_N domain-containing protein n=1 Tax=Macrostomum lignano TaxID=282301 RepID=A0A1I8F936_9PLAT
CAATPALPACSTGAAQQPAPFVRVLISCRQTASPPRPCAAGTMSASPAAAAATAAVTWAAAHRLRAGAGPLFEPERRLIVAAASADAVGPQPPLSAAEVARLARCSDQAMFLQLSARRLAAAGRQCQRLADCDSRCAGSLERGAAPLSPTPWRTRPNSTLAMESPPRRCCCALLANSAHGGSSSPEAGRACLSSGR